MSNKNRGIVRKKEIEFRARAEKGGTLLDNEIIETLLTSAHSRRKSRIIAKKLIDKFKGMGRTLSQDEDDLKTVKGVTSATVTTIFCMRQVIFRVLRDKLKRGPILDEDEKVVDYVKASIGHSEKENLTVLYLNRANYLMDEETYVGTVSQVHVYVEEIPRKASEKRATSIIICHNHPSGSLEISDRDEAMTKSLGAACATLKIKLANHIIVTDAGCVSFKKKGLI